MSKKPTFNLDLNLEDADDPPGADGDSGGKDASAKGGKGDGKPGKKKEEEKVLSFFVMPTSALKSLRDELRIKTDDEGASEILYRYGYTVGKAVIQGISFHCLNLEELPEKMPEIWEQFGLGHLKIRDIVENEVTLEISDSIEGQAIGHASRPSCDFTSGYMAGMVSTILDRQARNTEIDCICSGNDACRFRVNTNLEKIVPRGEKTSEEAMKFDVEDSMSYLIMEESPDLAFEFFGELVTHAYEGLCITRIIPKRVRMRYNLKETPVLWLRSDEGDGCIGYPHLGRLYETIGTFLNESSRPAIILDGFEYLITQNEYKSTLKFLQVIVENVAMKDGVLVIPVNPSALDTKDLNLLIRELMVIRERDELLKPEE